MKRHVPLCLLAGVVSLLVAQDRDFLSPYEVDQVRQAQDPNDRLVLYLKFARMRVDLVEQALRKEKPGRSLAIHNTLEDYSKIIEAIDSVSDDALRRKLPIDKSMVLVAQAEEEFLSKLSKIEPTDPKDLPRYRFVLQGAIDATSDSRELSLADSQKRAADLTATDLKEKKGREAMMPKAEIKERKKAEAEGQEQQKNIPSLYKPGEKPQSPPQ